MRAAVDVLAPWTPHDSLLSLSRAIARINHARLVDEGHAAEVVEGEACQERALVGRPGAERGIAYFGHGVEEEIRGSDDRPLFAGAPAERVQGRWMHCFACDTAPALGRRLVQHGLTVHVGYKTSLTDRWRLEAVPADVRPALDEVLTTVTVALASGVTDPKDLARRMDDAADKLLAVALDRDDVPRALRILADQLARHLTVTTS